MSMQTGFHPPTTILKYFPYSPLAPMPPIRLPPIRIVLISPRTLVRSGLSALLRAQPQVQLVGEFAAPAETAQADVFVWDVGAEKPRALPTTFLALLGDSRPARTWLEAGASGIVLETSTVEQMLDAIRQVARGETYLPSELAQQVLRSLDASIPPRQSPTEPLTDREREVLGLLAQGLSNKDIAQRLYVSVRTVEGHLANIYGKLQVTSRMTAALWAIQNL